MVDSPARFIGKQEKNGATKRAPGGRMPGLNRAFSRIASGSNPFGASCFGEWSGSASNVPKHTRGNAMIVRFSRWQERGRVRNHSRWPARRRRGGRAALVAAEVLETRLLLSADHLLFDPSNATTATAGNSFNLTVDVQNRRNRFDTGNHDAIRLSGGPLSGQVNARVSGGTADFDGLEIDKAGRYTILARDLTTGARATMFLTVTADTSDPEHLVFLHAPTSGTAGLTLGRLEVAVEDQFGNINRTNNGDPITLAVA